MYKKFAELLVKHNKTAYQVAKESGVTQTVLANWKAGRNKPNVNNLKRIADYFGVSIEYFLEGEPEKEVV